MPPDDHARTSLEVGVLEAIRPPQDEQAKLERLARDLLDKTRAAGEFFGVSVEPRVVGSFAKKTHLKGADLDVFLLFPTTVPVDQLKELGVKIAASVVPEGTTRYAEHPYLRGRMDGVRIDVVPAYAVRAATEMKTAVDRTPFHIEFVSEHLEPSQQDEVRLLKQFLKGLGAYGSEVAVKGFSGYLCELLIVKFQSFEATLSAAALWREGPVLSIEGTVPTEIWERARRDFPEPMVFIDPVDPARNVASPVSLDNLSLFVFGAREYSRAAKPTFFFPNPRPKLTPADIRARAESRGTRTLALWIKGSKEVDDIWVPQLYKSERALAKLFTTFGFQPIRSDVRWSEDDVLFLFELGAGRLSVASKHLGPAATHENARDFVEKWSGRSGQLSKPYVEEGRLIVDVAREHTDAAEMLKDRARSVAHGKAVADALAEKFEVLELDEAVREPYTSWTSDFFQPGLPWQF